MPIFVIATGHITSNGTQRTIAKHYNVNIISQKPVTTRSLLYDDRLFDEICMLEIQKVSLKLSLKFKAYLLKYKGNCYSDKYTHTHTKHS